MATAVAAPPPQQTPKAKLPPLEKMDYFRASGISWDEYEELADALHGRGVRLTFDRGELEYMTKSLEHTTYNRGLDALLQLLFEAYCLRSRCGGDMTFKRSDLDRGFEPDDCYWIANVDKVLGKRRLDFRVDPPPDLAAEVDITSSSIERLDIYAAMKVPEVWRFWRKQLRSGRLQSDGSYLWSTTSPLFPGLALTELEPFLENYFIQDALVWKAEFRAWLQKRLVAPTP